MGLPWALAGMQHQSRLAREFGGYYGVVNSRVQRIRSTITVLDSNIRIDGENNRRFKIHIAAKLTTLSECARESLVTVGEFISSRYDTEPAWLAQTGTAGVSGRDTDQAKGHTALRVKMQRLMGELRTAIREFVDEMDAEARSSDHVRIVDDLPDSTLLGDNSLDGPVVVDRQEAADKPFKSIPLTYIGEKVSYCRCGPFVNKGVLMSVMA